MIAKNSKTKRIMIVCAEKSGDLLGADLMKALKEESPEYDLEFIGVGGEEMQKQGLRTIFPMSDIAVMGLFEVLPHLRKILKRLNEVVSQAEKHAVDMLITIDGAEFSFNVAKRVKRKMGIPCVHYVSPQVWAWRRNRVYKMEKFLDHVLALFPFEEQYYKDTKLKCSYVGHPVMDRLGEYMAKISKKKLNYPPKVAILPGSRVNELKFLIPELSMVMAKLRKKTKDIKFVVSIAEGFSKEPFEKHFRDVEYVCGEDKFKKLKSCDAAIVCSGTANLELAMLGVPMVVCYKMNDLTYKIAKRIVNVTYISPVNIVAGKKIVKELIQDEMTADNILKAISPLLKLTKQRTYALADLHELRKKMSIEDKSAGARAAKIVKKYLR